MRHSVRRAAVLGMVVLLGACGQAGTRSVSGRESVRGPGLSAGQVSAPSAQHASTETGEFTATVIPSGYTVSFTRHDTMMAGDDLFLVSLRRDSRTPHIVIASRRNLQLPVSENGQVVSAESVDAATLVANITKTSGATGTSVSIGAADGVVLRAAGSPYVELLWAESAHMVMSVTGRDLDDATLTSIANGLVAK